MNQSSLAHKLTQILAVPAFYQLLQSAIGGSSAYEGLVHEYIRPEVGSHILDIGCGPAEILRYLPDVTYVGFDENPQYIDSARTTFGDRATFHCGRVNQTSLKVLGQEAAFDLVLAVAITHHLDDDEALQLFKLAYAALKPGGRLISLDCCYVEAQSPIARFIISRDRGQYVRTDHEYVALAANMFSSTNTKVDIRHDRLRVPYTHIIMECTK